MYRSLEFRSSGVQEFRSSGVQEFRSSGVQEFRSSGVQEFRSSGVQEFRSQEVRSTPGKRVKILKKLAFSGPKWQKCVVRRRIGSKGRNNTGAANASSLARSGAWFFPKSD